MFNPIYFKTDKYELIRNGTIWLTDKDSRYEASTIAGADTTKALNYVVLEDKATGERFLYVNLHLIVRGQDNYVQDADGNDTEHLVQELQVIYLREILQELYEEYDLPMFIGGDFNNSATQINKWLTGSVVEADGTINSEGTPTEDIEIVRSNPYANHVANGCTTTSDDFTELGTSTGAIDLWFVANFDGIMHSYEVIDNKVDEIGKYPSDHRPTRFIVTILRDKTN